MPPSQPTRVAQTTGSATAIPTSRSSPALHIFKDAFEELESAVTPNEARTFSSTTLKDVREAAISIERQLAARQSLCNLKRLELLFTGLQHYSGVVEVLCNGTPYLPWVWAPIKLILQGRVYQSICLICSAINLFNFRTSAHGNAGLIHYQLASDHLDAFKTLIEAYSQIAATLPRFDRLGAALKENLDFQEVLAVFYADILQFHRYTYKFLKRNAWKNFFACCWGTFRARMTSIIADLNKHADLVDKEANAYNIAEAQKWRDESRAWRQTTLLDTDRKEKEQSDAQYRSVLSWLDVNKSEQINALDSYKASPGSCDWILRNTQIVSWLRRQQDNPYLWLNGNPGSGKTVLTSSIVRYMQQDKHCFLLYYFCSYSSHTSTQSSQIARNLLAQLLQQNQDLLSYVYDEYVLNRRTASPNVLEQLLAFLVSSIPTDNSQIVDIRIIIDGLDECPDDQQQRLLNLLNRFVESNRSGLLCKALVSSRDTLKLKRLLKKKTSLSLNEERNVISAAIQGYIHIRMQEVKNLLEDYAISEDDFQYAEKSIAERSDGKRIRGPKFVAMLTSKKGMFLWARLVLDIFSSEVFDCRDLRMAIDSFPKGLEAFYERIIKRLTDSLSSFSMERVRRILSWLAFAHRPMKKFELQAALSIQEEGSPVKTLITEQVFDLCKPLVEHRADNTLAFVHFSLQEYLENPNSGPFLNKGNAYQDQTTTCLTELTSALVLFRQTDSVPEVEQQSQVVKGFRGLYIYANEFWIDSLLSCAELHGGLNLCNSPALHYAVEKLGTILNYAEVQPGGDAVEDKTPPSTLDPRLRFLVSHGAIYNSVKAQLIVRHRAMKLDDYHTAGMSMDESVKLVQRSISNGDPGSFSLTSPIQLSKALETYQHVIRYLLDLEVFPSLSASDFSAFKLKHAITAYSCRRPFCHHHFESEKSRDEHEDGHKQRLKCTVPECQYGVPFETIRALKNHIRKYHTQEPRTKIARPLRPPAHRPPTAKPNATSAVAPKMDAGTTATFVDDLGSDFNLDFDVDGPDVLENFDFDSFLQQDDDSTFPDFDIINFGVDNGSSSSKK